MTSRVVNALVQYQNEQKIFLFKDCEESQLYKMFLKKWDDRYDKESVESDVVEEDNLLERNKQVTDEGERQTRLQPPKKTQSYVDLESDFIKIRRSFNFLERKFKRKVGTKNVKKSQTYKYLLHHTIFDVKIC